jgi:hypothetical protein
LRQGVSAVSSRAWYPVGVLRHSAFEQSERFDSPLKTEHCGLLAGNVASGKCLTYAADAAHAAGLRSRRADVMQPDAAPLSFRGSCKPLALAMGFMTMYQLPFGYDRDSTLGLSELFLHHPVRPLYMLLRPLSGVLLWLASGALFLRSSRLDTTWPAETVAAPTATSGHGAIPTIA